MLKLWLEEPMDGTHYVHTARLIFDAEYEGDWLVEPVIKEIIEDVDKSIVLDKEAIKSPVLGIISPEKLSGGVKTLIMAYHDNTRIYNLSSCGDNLAKWVLRLAKDKDITMRLGYYMQFGEYGKDNEFEILILNSNRVVHSQKEFNDEMLAARVYEREREENARQV